VAVLDLLAQAEIRDFSSPRFFPYLVPAMTLFVGTALTVRFLRQFERSRDMNVELEDRVQAKHAELEANFDRMTTLEAGRVVAVERERIMREVHDGLGGQLVSTLAMVERGDASKGEVADAIRVSLDDMRMVINSLDPATNNLRTLLGTLRRGIESRLLRQGLRCEWNVTDLPELPHLEPHEALHVLRIVHEAVTNVTKHAGATTIRVDTGVRAGPAGADGIFIEVHDDGCGLGETAKGRGLYNMRQRADAIGAEFSVEAIAPGTRVTLWIPLSRE
jgi:signal transduction histidine kinase